DQAVLRPLTRNRSAPPYERARLAAGALTARVHAVRRADRLSSRARPHTVAVPAAPTSRLRPDRADRKTGQDQEQATDVATVEHTRRVFEAAAKLQDGAWERAVAHGPRPQPAPTASMPTHTQQSAVPPAPGRNTPTGGVA
ncbi:MobF family relaxase, partial [Streptomyces sp. NPDC005146]